MSNDNTPQLTMEYVLGKIDQLANDTAYLRETIAALQDLKPDHRFADSPEGDNTSVVKAQALGSAIKCRETTNQQLIALYKQMYEDLRGPSDNKLEQLQEIGKVLNRHNGPYLKAIVESMFGLKTSEDDEDDED